MAILVALSFFFLLVSETMPASSKNSIIGEFYSITLVEITISFFLNIIVLRFHHMTEEKVPHWVKVRSCLDMTFAVFHAGLGFIRKPPNRKWEWDYDLSRAATETVGLRALGHWSQNLG
jgi:hypothetical protein